MGETTKAVMTVVEILEAGIKMGVIRMIPWCWSSLAGCILRNRRFGAKHDELEKMKLTVTMS